MRVLPALLAALPLIAETSCRHAEQPASLSRSETVAMTHATLSLFDSLIGVHQAVPDTALFRRLYPPRDSLLYIQGSRSYVGTGASLLRATMGAHRMVRRMAPVATQRTVFIVDRNTAVVNAIWTVDVIDTTGTHHRWEGPITLVVARAGAGWVIKAHRE